MSSNQFSDSAPGILVNIDFFGSARILCPIFCARFFDDVYVVSIADCAGKIRFGTTSFSSSSQLNIAVAPSKICVMFFDTVFESHQFDSTPFFCQAQTCRTAILHCDVHSFRVHLNDSRCRFRSVSDVVLRQLVPVDFERSARHSTLHFEDTQQP